MKNRICYNLDGLLALLPNFHLQGIETTLSDEDKDTVVRRFYLVSREDIEKIDIYYSLWTTMKVIFKDGSRVSIMSSNINADDENLLRIVKNDIISPKVKLSDGYIEVTEDLQKWLLNQGLSLESLESVSEKFSIYSSVEYVGVYTPILGNDGHFGYSSENLRLDEREIQTVLEGIEDVLLRQKIRSILYARVFREVD